MLEVENISKSFSIVHSKETNSPLKDVSFDIAKGEVVGIIGKSGEGKSTIARILCGVLKKDSGEIFLNRENLFDKKGQYNRKIGLSIQLVSQVPLSSLDPKQKVGDAIFEILKKHSKGISKEELEKRTLELLEQVQLERDIVKRLPNAISSGQAQRIVIAKALAVSPKLLIADESTSMLDSKSQAQVIWIYRELIEKKKMSVLFISHDMNLVEAVANRCYAFEKGTLKSIY